ncbi:MAG: response regulator [Planctomycetes bacterium]|nr:response regulator [Planctomycetota bacterium]
MTNDEPTNILVVDDLPEKLLVYRTVLEGLGQNLITARSGEEALRAVLQRDFAVILLDVQMPGMSGLETASLIRQRKRSAHTPIIFLTAFADEMRAAEGYAQGAVDYITTPIVPGILQAKVRVFADLYRMSQQVKRQAEERVVLAEERMKREAAEEANRRLTFLARVGAVFGQSLDPEVAARDVVRLPLPDLADLAALVPLVPLGRYFLGRLGIDGPVVEVGSGGVQLDEDLLATANRLLAGEPEISEPGSAVVIPLRAGGRVFASLVLSRRSSGRTFTQADRTVAESFASRAAIALENARLYQEVQYADRQKNEFLSMLAHELRNPLAPIRNATMVLGQLGSDPVRVQWAHGVIDRQLTHLIRLVDDLLDVSRITLGKIRLEIAPVNLEAVVSHAVESVRPLLDQFHHSLEVSLPDTPVRVNGDKARLTQVFTNLLNNAAKYTEPGGRVWISVGTEADIATIRIRDTGIGISAELLPTVFDLFTQANRSLDRSQGGLGVGLTLVRRLVEMHGGSVEANSPGPGQGSSFTVRFPVLGRPIESRNSTHVAPKVLPNGPRKRILVVDDNHDGAESLAEMLGLLGNDVAIAHDGIEAICKAEEYRPEIVLMDVGMPRLNGLDATRRIREQPWGRSMMIIALTGWGQDADRALSKEAGCDGHLVKPVNMTELEQFLRKPG